MNTVLVNSNANNPRLVKADEAAKILAISPRKLWEITKRKDIKSVKIGRAVRYDLNDLATYIEKQKTG